MLWLLFTQGSQESETGIYLKLFTMIFGDFDNTFIESISKLLVCD